MVREAAVLLQGAIPIPTQTLVAVMVVGPTPTLRTLVTVAARENFQVIQTTTTSYRTPEKKIYRMLVMTTKMMRRSLPRLSQNHLLTTTTMMMKTTTTTTMRLQTCRQGLTITVESFTTRMAMSCSLCPSER